MPVRADSRRTRVWLLTMHSSARTTVDRHCVGGRSAHETASAAAASVDIAPT